MKYKKVSGYVGIRKNLQSGMYEASKKIKGKTFSKTFRTIKEATYWRNTFNPFEKSHVKDNQNKFLSFQDLWSKYEDFHFPKLELSSQGIKKQKIEPFMKELKDMNIYDITPDFLEYLIAKKKKQAKLIQEA